jgi:hypothetical protein
MVRHSSFIQTVESITAATGVWLEEHDYAGQDPYQIASKASATAKVPLLRPLLAAARPVVKWLHPYLPTALFQNFPATVIPQALGYALSAEALCPDSSLKARRILRIVQLLEQTRSPFSESCAWGLPFTWRDDNVFPPNWPVAFSSAVVGHALLDAKNDLEPALLENWIRGLLRYLVHECGTIQTNSGLCFRFVSGSDSPIINGNSLVAAFVARAAALLGDQAATTLAREAIAFVIETQNEDGSWFYTAAHAGKPADRIIDNRHSLYVLDGLFLFSEADPHSGLPVQPTLDAGWDYYSRNLLEHGVTKWDPHNTFPIDGHDMAQAIITTSLLGKHRERDELVKSTLEKFDAGGGRFHFKVMESGRVNRSVFIRWTQAPFYKALRLYLHHKSTGPSEEQSSADQILTR